MEAADLDIRKGVMNAAHSTVTWRTDQSVVYGIFQRHLPIPNLQGNRQMVLVVFSRGTADTTPEFALAINASNSNPRFDKGQ
jgi:hypothetical protein